MIAASAVWFVFTQYLPTFVTSQRPLPMDRCTRATTPALAVKGRMTLVIVDGLSFDYAKAMPELAWLREHGATRPLWVEFPSYTTPALLNFVTGLGPRDSGVRLNANIAEVTVGLDNLTQVARDAGRPITFLDGGEWEPFEGVMFAQGEVDHGRMARALSPFRPHDLSFIYYGRVDAAGHRSGQASPRYREEAQRVARFLWRTAAGLDLRRDVMLVVSDHGHLDDGGHGGVEDGIRHALFAAIGRDIAPGELSERPLRDVNATIAVLAGLHTPGCNTGRPMLDVTTWDDTRRAQASSAPFEQVASLLCGLDPLSGCREVASITKRLAAGDGSAVSLADDLEQALIAARQQRSDEAQRAARWRRLAGFAAMVLLLVVVLYRGRERWPGVAEPKSWLLPLVLVTTYAGLLYLRGYRLTFSKMPQREDFLPDAAIAVLVAAALVVWLSGWVLRARDADITTLVGTLVPWLALALYAGADPAFIVPPHAGLAVFLLGPGVLGAAFAAVLLVVIESIAREVIDAPPDQ